MRGENRASGALFSYVDLDPGAPSKPPLPAMRDLVNTSLGAMDASFVALYKAKGWPSIPPERLLHVTRLQMNATTLSAQPYCLTTATPLKRNATASGPGRALTSSSLNTS